MLKLTRLNNHPIVINPDHIGWADALPDTTLCMIGGEKIIVRESLEELIGLTIEFRRAIRAGSLESTSETIGDPPRFSVRPTVSEHPRRPSYAPAARRGAY